MKIKIDYTSLYWWYWFITLLAIISGLAGMTQGFYVAILISLFQFFHFTFKQGFSAFPTQVRFVYAILVLAGLFESTHFFYLAMLIGTVMVTFFDRCIIARILVLMPWNKNVKLS